MTDVLVLCRTGLTPDKHFHVEGNRMRKAQLMWEGRERIQSSTASLAPVHRQSRLNEGFSNQFSPLRQLLFLDWIRKC